MVHEHGHSHQGHAQGQDPHAGHSHADHAHGSHSHAGHSHGSHGHSHAPVDYSRAFAIGVSLNLGFVLLEAVYGIVSHSLALLADAGHNLSDVLSLLIAWGASFLVRRSPSRKYTYGFKGSSILASLLNAVFLLVAMGAIAWEAIGRISQPQAVEGRTVMLVAAVGILINGLTALMFASGRKGDINIRGAFLHMAADALVSAGVVAAGFAMFATSWLWLDPAVSLVLVAIVLFNTWGLLRESVDLALAAVPAGVDSAAVEAFLRGLPGVCAVHDLHIWAMSTTERALTAHLVLQDNVLNDALLLQIGEKLHADFGIGHPTIQFEHAGANHDCKLAPGDVV